MDSIAPLSMNIVGRCFIAFNNQTISNTPRVVIIMSLFIAIVFCFANTHAQINFDSNKTIINQQTQLDSLKNKNIIFELQQFESNSLPKAESLAMVKAKLESELTYNERLLVDKITQDRFVFTVLVVLFFAIGLYAQVLIARRNNKKLAVKNEVILKEKERAEESEKAMEHFFDNMSHELRTPLTLIVGPLEDVLDNKIDESSRSKLQIIQRGALHLQSIINELLELSRLVFKKIKLKATEENIVEITKEYLQTFKSTAAQRNIKLSFKSQSTLYRTFIDVERYRGILDNILSISMKFTEVGGVINVSIESYKSSGFNEQNSDSILIKITDTGIVIPSEKLKHVFDRFYQADEKSQSGMVGNGIGLAITKELVELHHGKIEVESEVEKGTTFKVFIPIGIEHLSEQEISVDDDILLVSEETKQEWAVEEEILGHQLEDEIINRNDKPVLLIVEDSPDMLTYTVSHFEKKYNVLKARDGEEGLKTAKEKIPDLIISDVMMPKMNGCEMTKRLKADYRTNHIPVIILTVLSSTDSRIEGMETGADAYVAKPFNARELKVMVTMMIDQRKKLREVFAKELNSGRQTILNTRLPSMNHKFIETAIEVVNIHIADEDFDVEVFSSEMALSRAQLHRKIKALSDKTIGEFIRTIRLNKAAELLKQNTDNVTQIAYETGFSNLSWFAKTFKEQFGVSPSDYKRPQN